MIYFGLLFLGIGSVAYGLTETVTGLELYFSLIIVLLGIGTSWFLAKSRLNDWIGILLLIIVGIVLLVLITGNLMVPVLSLLKSINHLVSLNIYPPFVLSTYMESVSFSYSEVISGIENIFLSVNEWGFSLLKGIPIYDQVAISLVWGLLLWILSGWAIWSLTRHRSVVLSMLPGGVVLSVTSSYTLATITPFIFYILSTLLLLALDNYDQSEIQWQKRKMDYPEDITVEFGLVAIGLAIGIVAVASAIPNFSAKALLELAQNITSHHIEDAQPIINSFGLNQSELSHKGFAELVDVGFPRSHLIGSGPELDENIIMTVRPVRFPEIGEYELIDFPYYWRAYTYDVYSGLGWQSSEIVTRTYQPGEEVLEISSTDYQTLEYEINILDERTRTFYSSGEILSADNVFKIAYRPTVIDSDMLITEGDFFSASIENQKYRVRSIIPVITEAELRLASSSYPEWIKERYLSLPDTIPARVYELTDQVVKKRKNHYDQAMAIQHYLRTFEYSLNVDLPPDEKDMVDYFLFDLQSGYCDYYATSMIVMSRILGIPARLAVGYYTGSYDEINNRYAVTEADAHSWVEIYFPEIGWIPFEPTAGRAIINPMSPLFGVVENKNFTNKAFPRISTILNFKFTKINILFCLFGGGAVMLLLILGIDEFRLRRLKPSETIAGIYQRLYSLAKWLKAGAKRDSTPYQFSLNILKALDKIDYYRFLKDFRISSRKDIKKLTGIYERTIFSPWNPDKMLQDQVIKSWKKIRVYLWLVIILSSLPKWFRNSNK